MLNRKKRQIAEHVKRKMQVLRNSGMPVMKIAKKFGVTDQSVYRHTHTFPDVERVNAELTRFNAEEDRKFTLPERMIKAIAHLIRALPDDKLVEAYVRSHEKTNAIPR